MLNFKFIKKYVVLIGFLISFSANSGSYEDFFKALKTNDLNVARQLLVRGFDPNTVDLEGRAALLVAWRFESLGVLDLLLDWPGTKAEVRNELDESLLMLAALKGQTSLVQKLISRDADVNKPGWAPLHYAATGGHPQIIQLLLDQSAYIDAESPNGTTPLMMAARYGNAACVKLLLDEGADVLLKNQLGLTALDFAHAGNRPDAIALLR
jgi:ankyrin repeat protein